jgi:hypothetical protein
MKRTVSITLATLVAVFFFAFSLTLTLAEQASATDIPYCCNPCPPSCTIGSGVFMLDNDDNLVCRAVVEGHQCFAIHAACLCF